mmetsp:Transcript_17057/g.52476  ORF Transcript_17057/g.52476 Transcript_17057/m.52476 type:complete len:361 (+) Transcript_17057:366-1448(+)
MPPKRKSRKKNPEPEPEPAEEVEMDDAPAEDEDDEAGGGAVSKREARQKKRGAPSAPEPVDEVKGADANTKRRFKLYVDEAAGRYVTDPEPCPALTAAPFEGGAKDKEKDRAENLAPSELDGLVKKMARYLLLRGTKRQPIVKARLGDAVLGDYKKLRITGYVLNAAAEELKRTWGYEVVQAPAKCGDLEYKGQAKDSFYVVHAKKRRNALHASFAAAGMDDATAAARGLLLATLAVVQASGGSVRERELYRQLNAMDERLPDEPPAKASAGKGGVGALGSLSQHLEAFVGMQYLVSYKDAEDETALALGPRALVDVGRFQIAQFSADALQHAVVDPSIIDEIKDAVRPEPGAAATDAEG